MPIHVSSLYPRLALRAALRHVAHPQPAWGVIPGAVLGLALVDSAWLTPALQQAWQALLHGLLPAAALQVAPRLGATVGWGLSMAAVALWALWALSRGPALPARLATLVGGSTAGVVALALAGRAFSAADALPFTAWALILGGVTGRVAFERAMAAFQRHQVEQQRQMRQALHQARADFLNQITREIRTPVNAVVGVADLLTETGMDADQRRHLNVFRRSADTLVRLVDDLNDLSRIEAGRIQLKASTIALVPLLHEQIAAIRQEAETKGLQVQLTLANDLARTVTGDRQRLSQVLSHLLNHAVKATRQGRIAIDVRPHARDGHLVRFAISDTSLSPVTGTLAGILEPFADAVHDRNRKSSGIGLALARRLCELMGGRLSVRHSPGKGTTVMFSALLPAPHAAAAQPTSAVTAPAASGTLPDLPTLHTSALTEAVAVKSVLLVDDNVSTGELIESMLDRQRFTVVSCRDGRQALQALEIARYDIVLMDLNMPELDGWSAIRILRRQELEKGLRRTPVIALGSAPFDVERQRALDAGFDQHLCKPLRKSRLLEAIAQATAAPAPNAAPAASATAPAQRPAALRYDHRDPLNLLSHEGLVDVETALASIGGDAAVYLDAIEHLAPALSSWPNRFRDAMNRREFERARQMALDMQSILQIVGAAPCATALGEMAAALTGPEDLQRHAAALTRLEVQLLPLLDTLQRAAERIRSGRQGQQPRKEQGHNSAF